jgi:hypothetical protein
MIAAGMEVDAAAVSGEGEDPQHWAGWGRRSSRKRAQGMIAAEVVVGAAQVGWGWGGGG